MFSYFSKVSVTEWPPIGKIAAHSAYDMFSWYKYLIVNLIFFPISVLGVGFYLYLYFGPLRSVKIFRVFKTLTFRNIHLSIFLII